VIRNALARTAEFLVKRFPERQSILGVYAVIVLLVYTWTLGTSFYRLPAWLYYLSPSRILSIYAYAFPINFAESVLALAGVLFLHYTVFLFFKKTEEFQARSILTAFALLASAGLRLVLYKEYVDSAAFVSGQASWWAMTAVFGLPLVVFAPMSGAFRKASEGFAERALVFLYIYLPLTVVALFVVIARNLY
jgi:hypothetical protein